MHRVFITLFFVCFLAFASGCAVLDDSGPSDPGLSQPTGESNQGYYYEFNDILVPQEMSLEADRSFTIETPNSTAGVLVFEGNVERLSLTSFFVNNMPKDNWNMRSAIRSTRTILIFEKAMRYAIITITDRTYSTEAEVWVAPRTDFNNTETTLTPAPNEEPQPATAEPAPAFNIEPPVPEQGLSE